MLGPIRTSAQQAVAHPCNTLRVTDTHASALQILKTLVGRDDADVHEGQAVRGHRGACRLAGTRDCRAAHGVGQARGALRRHAAAAAAGDGADDSRVPLLALMRDHIAAASRRPRRRESRRRKSLESQLMTLNSAQRLTQFPSEERKRCDANDKPGNCCSSTCDGRPAFERPSPRNPNTGKDDCQDA